MSIKTLIRTIPNYPKEGIMFRDITTLIKDPLGLRITIKELVSRYEGQSIDKVVAIESRGFIFGAPLAHELGAGFVPIRKPGKLPFKTYGQDYELEYGYDRVEIHTDAIEEGERVVLVDDLIATGGTAQAAAALVKSCGGLLIECAFIVDLPEIGGRTRLESMGLNVFCLTSFEGH